MPEKGNDVNLSEPRPRRLNQPIPANGHWRGVCNTEPFLGPKYLGLDERAYTQNRQRAVSQREWLDNKREEVMKKWDR